MKHGISDKSMHMIQTALAQYQEIENAKIFGSRALGTYKNGSDIDLALYGKDVSEDTIRGVSTKLNEELPLPYYFDVVHYDSLSNSALKEHIRLYAMDIYKKTSKTPL